MNSIFSVPCNNLKSLIKLCLVFLPLLLAQSAWTDEDSIQALTAAGDAPAETLDDDQGRQKIPSPPERTSGRKLIEKFGGHPGGKKRLEMFRKGKIKRARRQAFYSPTRAGEWVSGTLTGLVDFVVPNAQAAELLSIELKPTVGSLSGGNHSGLFSSDPYAVAGFHGGYITHSYPRNAYVRLLARPTRNVLGFSTTNPYGFIRVRTACPGNFAINANIITGGKVDIYHYAGNGQYPLLSSRSPDASWAWQDYSTVQYLEAGDHYFYFVVPSGGYVSRFTVDEFFVFTGEATSDLNNDFVFVGEATSDLDIDKAECN